MISGVFKNSKQNNMRIIIKFNPLTGSFLESIYTPL